MSTQLYPHIIADPDILAGKPVVEGTQVPASTLVEQVAAGKPFDEIAREHGITMEDVRAALHFAAQRASEPVASGDRDTTTRPSIEESDLLTPAGAEEAHRLGLDPATLSPLGRRLLDQRARIRASGIPMLTWEELDAEMDEMRRRNVE